MTYTREQIEDALSLQDCCPSTPEGMISQLLDENDALREDGERLDWLQSSKTSHGFCHAGGGEYVYYAHQQDGYPDVRRAIDAARAKPCD